MNWEQLKGIVERIATFGVAWASGRGWIPGDQIPNVVAVITLLGAIFWGWKVNTPSSLVAATASLPVVDKVVVEDRRMAADLTKPDAVVTTQ